MVIQIREWVYKDLSINRRWDQVPWRSKQINVKLIRYQFWCTRCAFRLLRSLQWCSGRKSWTSEKKGKNLMSRRMKTKESAIKLSQIRRRIELCLREIILLFSWIYKIYFYFWQYNSFSYFKASTEVLSNWAVETKTIS